MFGFAGEFVFGPGRADADLAGAMVARLAGRGVGEATAWTAPDGRCAIGFRGPAGADAPAPRPPMASRDGTAAVAFTGQIDNLSSLRERMPGPGAEGRARDDHEVLPALWRARGTDVLEDLEGTFALVAYDAGRGELFLARDRLGVKPLWYAALDDRVLFASEGKALSAHPRASAEVDPSAVAFYLTLGYVPAPRSIWRGVVKLAPAHWLRAGAGGCGRPRRYWDLPDRTIEIAPQRAVERVRETVTRAVTRRLRADEAMGVLLSGGVDSSIVTAVASRAVGRAGGVRTFAAGFDDAGFDERPWASAVAAHLGTDHRELRVDAGDAAALLDELVAQYDEPFADSSALPTFLICRAAAEHVGVALTGDGGDEAFAGYDRHRAMHLAEGMGPTSWAATKLAGAAAAMVAPADERSRLRRLVRFAAGLDDVPARQYFRYRRLFAPEHLAALLEADFAAAAEVEAPRDWFCELYEQGEFDDEAAYAQQHDLRTYLPDDLLVKADTAALAGPLELRSPMLDPEVAALGLSLPAGCKIRRRRGKAVLREAFGELLPGGVVWRGKQGFGAPVNAWLRGPLAETLRETLLSGPSAGEGPLRRAAVEELIADHMEGRADHRHRLWALLWLGRWLAARS